MTDNPIKYECFKSQILITLTKIFQINLTINMLLHRTYDAVKISGEQSQRSCVTRNIEVNPIMFSGCYSIYFSR